MLDHMFDLVGDLVNLTFGLMGMTALLACALAVISSPFIVLALLYLALFG